MSRSLKRLLVDILTSMPAFYVLALGMGHLVHHQVSMVVGALLLLMLNNLGRQYLEKK